MTMLTPLGFLAAIAILILIIIYIIRPNYQQKYISSTFVWKLSLKYKKKRLPTSKLRDILIIICQIASLACCATILAQPIKMLKAEVKADEVVIVLDASASMSAGSNTVNDYGEEVFVSRFTRALDKIETQASNVLETGGFFSLIRADDSPSVILDRITSEDKSKFNDAISALREEVVKTSDGFAPLEGCGLGGSDMEKAMSLCENILDINPSAVTYVYTDTTYISVPKSVKVIDCRDNNVDEDGKKIVEYNVGILDVVPEFFEGSYSFKVRVASFDSSREFGLQLEIFGIDSGSSDDELSSAGFDKTYKTLVSCDSGEEKVITFKYAGPQGILNDEKGEVLLDMAVISYSGVRVSLISPSAVSDDVDWSMHVDYYDKDDVVILPESNKPKLKILYASALRTPFFEGILDVYQDPDKSYFKDVWDFEVVRLRPDKVKDSELNSYRGYDFYIYEGRVPKDLPTDGVVLMVGVESLPSGVSGSLSGENVFPGETYLKSENLQHPVMRNFNPDNVFVTKTRTFTPDENFEEIVEVGGRKFDGGYTVLLECPYGPVLAVKNGVDEKVAILTASPAFSNITIQSEFAFLVTNIIEYFLPATIEKTVFSVGEEIILNCRGFAVGVQKIDEETEFEPHEFNEFPAKIKLHSAGEYEVITMLSENKEITNTQKIVVQLPASESNINSIADSLDDPYHGANFEDFMQDLAVYVAAALVFFLFAEWLLHLREGI